MVVANILKSSPEEDSAAELKDCLRIKDRPMLKCLAKVGSQKEIEECTSLVRPLILSAETYKFTPRQFGEKKGKWLLEMNLTIKARGLIPGREYLYSRTECKVGEDVFVDDDFHLTGRFDDLVRGRPNARIISKALCM